MTDKQQTDINAEKDNTLYHAVLAGDLKSVTSLLIDHIIESKTVEEKKRKEKEFDDFILKQIMTDFVKNAIVDIKNWMKERQENIDKLKKATNIMKNWNTHDAQLFLMTQNVDVKGMNDNDLVDAMREQINDMIDTDKSYAQRIAEKAEQARKTNDQYNDDPELTEELNAILDDAKAAGYDIEMVINEANEISAFSNGAILNLASATSFDAIPNVNIELENSNDPFASAFNTISTSFASSLDNRNATQNISDPFNAAASDLGIEPENKNDLENKVDQRGPVNNSIMSL